MPESQQPNTAKPIDVHRLQLDDGWQERLKYPLDAVSKLESGSPLVDLFDYLKSQTRKASEFRQVIDNAPNLTSHISAVIAVGGIDDPYNYRIVHHIGSNLVANESEWVGSTLGEVGELAGHSDACAEEYFFCQQTQQPAYHRIEQKINGQKDANVIRHYSRIVFPLKGKAGQYWLFVGSRKLLQNAEL